MMCGSERVMLVLIRTQLEVKLQHVGVANELFKTGQVRRNVPKEAGS